MKTIKRALSWLTSSLKSGEPLQMFKGGVVAILLLILLSKIIGWIF